LLNLFYVIGIFKIICVGKLSCIAMLWDGWKTT